MACCWRNISLWINTCLRIEQFPAAPQNQLRLTCLPFSPQSSPWASLPMMPTSRTHGMTREEKARGEAPGLRRHFLANAPPLCFRMVWQTSLINHRLPSHGAEAQRGISPSRTPVSNGHLSELAHQMQATSHTCYRPPRISDSRAAFHLWACVQPVA